MADTIPESNYQPILDDRENNQVLGVDRRTEFFLKAIKYTNIAAGFVMQYAKE